jgi:ferredoxin
MQTSTVRLTVNGRPERLELDPRTSLLDLLREHLHLSGTEKGCNQGACGACTVLVDERRINADIGALEALFVEEDDPSCQSARGQGVRRGRTDRHGAGDRECGLLRHRAPAARPLDPHRAPALAGIATGPAPGRLWKVS